MLRKLISGSGLSLKQIEEKYADAWTKFEAIKTNYSGLFGIFRRHMRSIDKKSLIDCIDSLLLLSSEDIVQKQSVAETENIRESLHYRIRELDVQILEYIGSFRDSGNERLGIRPKVYPLLIEKLR